MASGYNKVILIGNLGDEPQMRTASSGTTIANFSLAVNEVRRNPQTGELTENTEWIRCVAFGRVAETIGRFLHKGSQVHVEGKIRTSSYEKDGQKRYSTEVVLDPSGLLMLGSPRSQNQGGYQSQNNDNYGGNSYNQGYRNQQSNSYGNSYGNNSYGNNGNGYGNNNYGNNGNSYANNNYGNNGNSYGNNNYGKGNSPYGAASNNYGNNAYVAPETSAPKAENATSKFAENTYNNAAADAPQSDTAAPTLKEPPIDDELPF